MTVAGPEQILSPSASTIYQMATAVAPQSLTLMTAQVSVVANDGTHVPTGLTAYIYDVGTSSIVATSSAVTANTQTVGFVAVAGHTYKAAGSYGSVTSGAYEMDLQMTYTPSGGGGGGVTVGVRRSGVWTNASAVKVFRSGVWTTATHVSVRRSGAWVNAR